MVAKSERILVVEGDPVVSDLIARQALGSQGFEVKIVVEGNEAIREALSFAPDVVIANIDLPGLSGKDLMAAFTSQNLQIPVIMVAPQGKERDVIQAFRLGASDYLPAPVREAEVVAVVERAMKSVRARRERERLQKELSITNTELQKRVIELTTISGVGKAVTSVTDQQELFQQIVNGGVKITGSDLGWLLLLDERNNKYVLSAQQGLPKSLHENINKPWDDGVSSLVAMSGETLAIHGEAIDRFKITSLGKAALVTPVKAGNQSIALITVMRKAEKPYMESEQTMLEAVSDYASISMVNARLFRALDHRASSLQSSVEQAKGVQERKYELIQSATQEVEKPLAGAKAGIDSLIMGETENFSPQQQDQLGAAQAHLQQATEIVEALQILNDVEEPKALEAVDLNSLINQALGRFQMQANNNNLELNANLPADQLAVQADKKQLGLVLDALLTNAVKFSLDGGTITIGLELARDHMAHIFVQDQGIGISKKNLTRVFNQFYRADDDAIKKIPGIGMGLSLVQAIIQSHRGKVWAESHVGKGSVFHVSLPLAR